MSSTVSVWDYGEVEKNMSSSIEKNVSSGVCVLSRWISHSLTFASVVVSDIRYVMKNLYYTINAMFQVNTGNANIYVW